MRGDAFSTWGRKVSGWTHKFFPLSGCIACQEASGKSLFAGSHQDLWEIDGKTVLMVSCNNFDKAGVCKVSV